MSYGQFWTTFFEQAAQIRVPTYEEEATEESVLDSESAHEVTVSEVEADETQSNSQSFNPDRTPSEHSFMPGQGAIMSTPATVRQKSHYSIDSREQHEDQTPSWTTSLESPLIRLDREIQSLTRDDEVSAASSSALQADSLYDESQDVTERQILQPFLPPQSERSKGKAREPPEPLLRGVLRRTADPTNTSPLKVKSRTPVIKNMNPYLPPNGKPSEWKGVVDLSDPTVLTPGRKPSSSRPRSAKRPGSKGPPSSDLDLDDDSFDQKLGMSPPITMDFARLPSAKTPKLGKTPRKQAAERIMQSLVNVEKHGGLSSARPGSSHGLFGVGGSVESSMSNVPTPPSLSRYARHAYPSSSEMSSSIADASLESMMRRVGLSVQGFDSEYGPEASIHKADSTVTSSAAPSLPSSSSYNFQSNNIFSAPPTKVVPPEPDFGTKYNLARVKDDDLDFANPEADDSQDSLDYEDPPVTGEEQPLYDDGDSFDSSRSSDSFGDEVVADDMDNPFVEGMDDNDGFDDEDSFDDPNYQDREEETLFGVPPAQRLAAQAAAQSRVSEQNFRMLGEELLEDTIGIGAQMAKAGRVDETPTPWGFQK